MTMLPPLRFGRSALPRARAHRAPFSGIVAPLLPRCRMCGKTPACRLSWDT